MKSTKINPKYYTITGVIIILIAYYFAVDWTAPIPYSQFATVTFVAWIGNIIGTLLLLFFAFFAGVLVQKGIDK